MTRGTPSIARREDTDIFLDLRHALDHRFSVPPEVQVQIESGTVKLLGMVQWAFQSAEAEDAVRHVDGVQSVVNEIEVAHLLRAFAA